MSVYGIRHLPKEPGAFFCVSEVGVAAWNLPPSPMRIVHLLSSLPSIGILKLNSEPRNMMSISKSNLAGTPS